MHIFNINAHYKFLTCPPSALLAEQHNTIRLLHSQQKQSLVTGEKGWEYVKQFSEQLNLDTEHVTHYRYLSPFTFSFNFTFYRYILILISAAWNNSFNPSDWTPGRTVQGDGIRCSTTQQGPLILKLWCTLQSGQLLSQRICDVINSSWRQFDVGTVLCWY